ncbi:MAG: hypothetical protein NT007_05085 [Candidatus Kapabacteria bacterium]|nr:hypothetical protein [Candidatus Kapabacteria bacterium]
MMNILRKSSIAVSIILVVTSIFLLSCSSSRRIVSFYQGRDTILYFVRPTDFFVRDNSTYYDCSIDFTIRKVKDTIKFITCNFTIESGDIIFRKSGQVGFHLETYDNKSIKLNNPSILYKEIDDNIVRYTTSIDPNDSQFLPSITKFVVESPKNISLKASNDFLKSMEKTKLVIIEN